MAEPDDAELRRLLQRLVELGATQEELDEAVRTGRLSDFALDVAIRPPGETVTLERFIESSELDPDDVRSAWAALGLPAVGPVRVTPDMAAALRFLNAAGELFETESATALARVMGSSSSRIAEALISAFRVDVELPEVASGTGDARRILGTIDAAHELLPLFIEALNAIFRRHMVLASYQIWMPDEARAAVTHQRAVGFADLVSSTETVRAASPRELAVKVREFEARVWDLVTDADGRVVKLIGDEAMFVIEDPVRACQAALDLIAVSPDPVRVGLAYGTVVALYGDYYGETVNLAARLVGAAEASTLAVSQAVRDRAASAFAFDALPERELKGFGDVTFYRAGRR